MTGSRKIEEMEWTDEGIILGSRRHGEAHAVVELMTAAHGRHLGLVRGGGSRKRAAALQPGNSVRAVWRARLDEHLGNYTLDATTTRADRLMGSATASYGLQTLAAYLRLLPERDPHTSLYRALEVILDHLHERAAAGALMVRFELALLAELGFGLDLESCAATGAATDLIYVSPKSGRAVSRAAGEKWKGQLLALPAFLREPGAIAQPEEIESGFVLTGFFLAQRVFEPRGIEPPPSRAALLGALARAAVA
jgi:DNA repair protein RecO (recombination protein O)